MHGLTGLLLNPYPCPVLYSFPLNVGCKKTKKKIHSTAIFQHSDNIFSTVITFSAQ